MRSYNAQEQLMHIPQPATIVDMRYETPNTITYTFAFQDERLREQFRFHPGQFNMLYVPGIGEAPMCICSDPLLQGQFQQTIRAVGDVTNAIANMGIGDIVGQRGPYGRGWALDDIKGHHVLMIAGGIGLASLRPALEYMFHHRDEYGAITILYGARTPHDLLYTSDYERWMAQPDTYLLLTVDNPSGEEWHHHVGVVTSLFEHIEVSPDDSVALICGPEVMMVFTIVELLRRQVPAEHIYLAVERRMRCGVGLCGHCQCGPKFVCRDGPVFSYAELRGIFGQGI